ncbi:hypothetical protein SLS62_002333 [Diatrype stigma]|uniref:Uncharacterized protein n=1 Tax=Diatrype stigma TaxID=117547 RepID=A0AAN9YSH9_9PEZI
MADKKSSPRPSATSVREEVEMVVQDNFGDDPKKHVQQPDRFGSFAKTDPKEIALVKKLDWYMLPILWLMYFLNFLDRNAVVNGKLNNMSEELNMTSSQYNTCISVFFVG